MATTPGMARTAATAGTLKAAAEHGFRRGAQAPLFAWTFGSQVGTMAPMIELLHTFLARTPALLWAGLLVVFVGLELALRRGVPWAARWPNLLNGVVVLLTIFAAAPLIGLTFLGVRRVLGLGPAPVVLDEGYPGAAVLGGVAFLLLYDLGYYAFHRLQHANRWLWRFHAVHHSDTRMNASTYVRQHFLENVFQALLILLPLLLLVQVSPATAAWAAGVTAAIQFFAHADLPIHYGPLSRVLLSPLLHRVHHSSNAQESGANFASTFPLWDVVFGTYRPPTPVARTGLHDGRTMDGFGALVWGPFRTTPATPETCHSDTEWNEHGLRACRLPPHSLGPLHEP